MGLSLPPSPYPHIFDFKKGQPDVPWPKLDTDALLSILHAKYWGQDIREEKRQWQEKQTKAKPMNTDQSGNLPANFPLYFDIDDWTLSRMWIREDYVVFYDYCTAYFNQPEIRTSTTPPSIAITGQLGIGKCHGFSFYSLS